MTRPILITLLLAAALGGCAGTAAREHVALPAARTAYESVINDVERGIADGLADGELNQTQADALNAQAQQLRIALAFNDLDEAAPAIVAAAWPVLKPWAERGVADRLEDGEIGPGVAASFTERINNFTEALGKITSGG